jgi:hypothetical protein
MTSQNRAADDPSRQGAQSIAKALEVDPAAGLSTGEGAGRLVRHGPNQLSAAIIRLCICISACENGPVGSHAQRGEEQREHGQDPNDARGDHRAQIVLAAALQSPHPPL